MKFQKEGIITENDVERLSLIDFKNAFEDMEDQKRLMGIWDYLVYNRYIVAQKDGE